MPWGVKVNLAFIAECLGLLPARTVCECSVGAMCWSVAKEFEGRCERLLLIEPNPEFALAARREVPTADVKQVAVGTDNRQDELIDNGESSYLQGTWSPTPVDPKRIHPVEVVTFDTIDDGRIDVFNLDCEGQELAVLHRMTSRPKLIAIEVCFANPQKQEIQKWLQDNQYALRCENDGETLIYIR